MKAGNATNQLSSFLSFNNNKEDDLVRFGATMSNIPYYLRLKPRGETLEAKEAISLIESQDDTHVRFKDTTASNKFTKIFNDISQLDLYTETLQDLTTDILEDKDSVFFTLGPSNSGKSYSIYGDGSNPGIAIYSLNEIFRKIDGNFADYKTLKRHFGECFVVSSNAEKNCTGEFGLSISVFEIYNDRIRDLTLDPSKTLNQSLDIITDAKDGKIKPNKTRQIFVANLDEAKLVIHKSVKRRAVSSTNLNQTSSRSHLFIYFNLHKVTASKSVKTSRLTIADLAGSERTKTAKTAGKEFKEGNYTNTSLTELGRCLALMKSKKFDRSLLRTNKLTRLLLSDLFGNFNQNRIKILLTLDPYSNLSTILHAIRYIQPVARVTINSERNSIEPDSEQILLLNEDVRILKEQNKELSKEVENSKEALTVQELEVRQQLSEEYESRMKEMDIKHSEELNRLKDEHQLSVDKRLDLLSTDYEEKIAKKDDKYAISLDDLNKKYYKLEAEYNKLVDNPTAEVGIESLKKQHADEIDALKKELEALNSAKDLEIESLKVDKTNLEGQLEIVKGEFQSSIEKLQKDLENAQSQAEDCKRQLDDALEDNKSYKKKNKKMNKELAKMNKEISNRKRKSEVSDCESEDIERDSAQKKRKSDDFGDDDFRASSEEELMSLSPVKLGKSPSKEKSLSPSKKLKSPHKKKTSTESPKKQPLQESMFDNILPSPKVKAKSPTKGKKKLQKVRIIDESFSD